MESIYRWFVRVSATSWVIFTILLISNNPDTLNYWREILGIIWSFQFIFTGYLNPYKILRGSLDEYYLDY